jgi:acyl-CoA oxidase
MKQILETERAKSKIDRLQLAHLLYRGKERFEYVLSLLQKAEVLGLGVNPKLAEMSRDEALATVLKNASVMRTDNTLLNIFDEDNTAEEMFVSTNYHHPGSIGAVMSFNVIKTMATDEQAKEWNPRIQNFVWLTCYAQTELGCGSDVQNLQTLAVYHPDTQLIEFHTPSVEAIKWWPGELGIVCSHAVVFARLMSKGKDHGVQPFFIELRNPATHVLHRGVEVGDIGPKLGFATKDNGFLRFDRYLAPKSCLLGRYINLDAEGNVMRQGNPKIMYTALMRSRATILCTCYSSYFKALTITTRYSIYRTQFKDSKGNPIHIYDYQMQREKLFRELAKAYIVNLATATCLTQVSKNMDLVLSSNFSELQSTHIMLCCLKSMFTYWQVDSYSNLIKACGGHGYSYYPGLIFIFTDTFPNTILEGENSVRLLQVSRYLLKCFARVQKGNTAKVTGFFSFIKEMDKHLAFTAPADDNWTSLDNMFNLFRRATCYLLQRVGTKMFALVQEHKDPKLVWDTMVGNDCQRLAKVFSVQLIMDSARERLQSVKTEHLKSVLERLLTLGFINLTDEYSSPLVESGGLNPEHISSMLDKRNALLDELRNDGLVLAEGMQWPDSSLGSAIGSSDKDPYETLYHWAKTMGQLNQYEGQIHPAVIEYQLKTSRFREERL